MKKTLNSTYLPIGIFISFFLTFLISCERDNVKTDKNTEFAQFIDKYGLKKISNDKLQGVPIINFTSIREAEEYLIKFHSSLGKNVSKVDFKCNCSNITEEKIDSILSNLKLQSKKHFSNTRPSTGTYTEIWTRELESVGGFVGITGHFSMVVDQTGMRTSQELECKDPTLKTMLSGFQLGMSWAEGNANADVVSGVNSRNPTIAYEYTGQMCVVFGFGDISFGTIYCDNISDRGRFMHGF